MSTIRRPLETPVAAADPDVLVGIPVWMRASGYGDLIGKVTDGADWIMAIRQGMCAMAQDPPRMAVSRSASDGRSPTW